MDAIIQQRDCAPKRIVNVRCNKAIVQARFPNFLAKVCWISDADTAATQIILEPPVPM